MTPTPVRSVALYLFSSLLLLSLLSSAAQAQDVQRGATVIQELKHDTSAPLREMPLIPATPSAPALTLPVRHPMPARVSSEPDTVLQNSSGPLVSTSNGLSFDGVNDRDGGAPPDTNASVGATQIVETVNVSYQVFDKTTGNSLLGPAEITSIWSGFGGLCQTGPNSDPVVLYDKAAQRWLIAIVAFTSNFSSNVECVAVSTTSDATGSFNRYAFSFGSNLNDYTKLAVWPDAYYLSANLFPLGGAFIGADACALDRTNMLAGTAATMQCFQRSTSDYSLLPSDLDGSTAPPSGEPDFFVELGASTTLNLFKFHVDFTTPSNSTFTGPTPITVASYSDACGLRGTCIPQKGTTTRLDSLGDRLMFRLAYRNLGDHEALVAAHSITVSTHVGVRWYEIRSPSATPTLFQSGTFSPDSNFRWMPSIAMDQAGDIAVGYSKSSTAMFPSIAYTGRVPTDALGTMENEDLIFSGLGSQTAGLTRWGDYTGMAIDPVDDCTFWHANEYLPANGSFNWSTRLVSFHFPSCVSTVPDFSISASPASRTVTQGNGTSYTATISAINGFAGTVAFSASGLPSGANATFTPPSVTGSGSSTMNVTTSTTTLTGTYTITVTGTSGTLVHSTAVTLIVNSSGGTPDFSISATPPSITIAPGQHATYTVTVTALNGFTGTVTFSVSGVPANSASRFSSATVTGSGSVSLVVAATSSTPAGTYTLTVTGTSGALVHSTTVSLTVT